MSHNLTILILAGGQSERMGTDKAQIPIRGMTMLEHACNLARQYDTAHTAILGRPEHPWGVADENLHQGPARAIASYLHTLNKQARLLVLPVDMPFLRKTQTDALLAKHGGAYFKDQYLPFSATVEPDFSFSGIRMKELLAALRIKQIPIPDEWKLALTNVNTPSALAALPQ